MNSRISRREKRLIFVKAFLSGMAFTAAMVLMVIVMMAL